MKTFGYILLRILPPALTAGLALNGASSIALALAATLWMVSWWVFEVMPLGVTALIPIALFPTLNLMPVKEVTTHYANSVIYLFLGGFVIARALEKTALNERFALYILKYTGRSAAGIIFGFMLATAFLSMWVSNTATTVMMVPIALSVVNFLSKQLDHQTQQETFNISLFLAIAYSANIGGIMTPVGTPPNVVLLGFLNESYNIHIDFWKWMAMTVPVGACVLALQYLLLRRLFPTSINISKDFLSFVQSKFRELGQLDAPQKTTLRVFVTVCTLWITKDLIHFLSSKTFLNDTSIAIFGAILLFLIPTSKKDFSPVLSRQDISYLPWNIILLFGGGMAMAAALKSVGVIEAVTSFLATQSFSSPFMTILVLAAMSLFLTEIMSNVALCVVALPIFMELGVKLGINPVMVGIPVALCASMAFSLPISTPPNAIVFGTQHLEVKHMLKAGLILNILALTVVMSIGWYILGIAF